MSHTAPYVPPSGTQDKQARRAVPALQPALRASGQASPGATLPPAGDKPLPYPLFTERLGEGARDIPPTPTTGPAVAGGATGIARLAALSPVEREKAEATYYRLPVRSVLNRVESRRVGFEWSINPYRGCEFGCQYCYARYTHEYMELEATEFERRIYVKEDAAARLRVELKPERVLGRHIAIGAATDPYQPAERQFGVTRGILGVLLEFARKLPRNALSLSITTKSNLVLRDLDLLSEVAHCQRMYVNVSVTTVNARLARVLEPRAPRPDLRLEAVRRLNAAGVPAGVFAAPVLPGITDRPGDLEALTEAAAGAGAQWLCANAVFLMPSSQKKFFPFLEEKFPRLVRQYRKWYARSGYAPEEYGKKISARMKELRARHGLSGRWPDDERASPELKPESSALVRPTAAPQLELSFASQPD